MKKEPWHARGTRQHSLTLVPSRHVWNLLLESAFVAEYLFSILILLKFGPVLLQQCWWTQKPKGNFCYLPQQQKLNQSFPWIRSYSFICQGSFSNFSCNGGKLWRRREKRSGGVRSPVNKPDNAQMHALSAKAEPLVRSLFKVWDENMWPMKWLLTKANSFAWKEEPKLTLMQW